MTGIEAIAQAGAGVGTRVQDMRPGSAILVIASISKRRRRSGGSVKQAADRGVKVVVANARPTKLDRYAAATIHYEYGDAVKVMNEFRSRAQPKDSRRELARVARRRI